MDDIFSHNALVTRLGRVGQKTMVGSTPVTIASDQTTLPVTFTPSPVGNFGIDAGGRTRVSQMTTLFDGKILGGDDVHVFENTGDGTAVYTDNKMTLSATSGKYIIRQSRRVLPYFSGKVQLVEATCDGFHSEAGVTKRVGYFTSSAVAPYTANLDGFFIEDDGTKKTLFIYRKGTVTAQVLFTAMDNYTLVSGYNWQNFTVMAFDFLWLGGAILRFWLKTDLGFVLVHTVNYSGTAQNTFTLSPNQTLRYEVRGLLAAGSLRYICSQVSTEGSIDESGCTMSIYNATPVTTNVIGTIYALKGLKKQVAFRDTAVQIIDIAVSNTASSDAGIIMLLWNPTLSAPLTYVNNDKIQDGSPAVPATPPTVSSVGRVVAALPISTAGGSSSIMKQSFMSFLSQSITDTMDEYVLAYMPITNNQSVAGVITIKDY